MEIQYSGEALNDLQRLPVRHADQITRKIDRLRAGLVGDIKALVGTGTGDRLRSGDYRILFDCDGQTVLVRSVKNRRDAYR